MLGACTDNQGNNACLVENVVVHSGGVNDTITTHKPITCARLNPLPNAVAYPRNCTMSKTSYLDSCIFSCKPGYSSTNGQTTLVTTCGAPSIPGSSDGTWTEPIDGFNCEDTTPPSIICPGDITADNDPGMDGAEVTWAAPVATDTTGVTPVVLSSVTPPHRFTIGLHTLNYTAVDEAGLSFSCHFQVEIRDITDPECISCPEDINVFSSNREFAIQWDEPTWIDNSGNIADVFGSHVPGSLFYWGSPQFVYYIARDNAGNQGFCNFTVTVKQHTCPYQAPPRNGALACDTWLGGQFCSVSCNRDFGFAREPESLYYCKQEEGGGRWSSLFPSFQEIIFPWPDCTRTSSPGVVGTFQVQYYTSDCAVDTEEIRQNFIEQAKMLNAFAVGFCMDEAECNIDNVHVSCGTSRGARTTHYFISVDFNLVVHAKESSSFNGSFVQAATAHIDLFVVGIETTIANGAFNISVGNHTISTIPGTFSTAGDTVLMCSQGSVLKDSDCLSCPAGTFSNGTSCTDCPPGFYQDKEAQISCLPCLNGTATYHPRAVSAEECKELCEDYTFFDDTTNDCRNVSTTAAAEIGSHGCPPDTAPYSNSCYILLDESADYMTARKICESGGGYLVVVKDEGEHQFLIDHLNSTVDIWIGLDDIINEGTFVYSDGSPLGAFSKWATGEPNDAVGNNDCVHLWPLAGMTWADTICTKEKRFVCEFEK
ncbi:PREDICTED: sushi, von Willebrand factor type A, EGF and pentraxin domain-containing protein 1-like [Branchiostoma belcheri]|uniref:Sushi, von Willebrand factor type A, EGF and pentraxin domain-containing protein 1-like n=1 Tax=Branchiostoma belcheri TaxID=7741 RepID=A0A6P4ZAV9_BRABE|nr:PREDICTED: sushi, von Willebrand factor type A, EGF and pentraxin domain-containing protein 1-like [Branchiostoma belcheri]